MRKRNRWTRLLAMILAVAMVLSSQSVTALADSGIIVGGIQKKSVTTDETEPTDETDAETNSLPSSDGETGSAEIKETQLINQPGVITGDSVNLRETPSTEGTILATLTKDTGVEVVNLVTTTEDKQWYEVKADDQQGYVSYEYVTVSEVSTLDAGDDESEGQDDGNADLTGTAAEVYEHAKELFGEAGVEGSEGIYPVASVEIIRTDSKGNAIKAGDTLSFRLNWNLEVAPPYAYSGFEQPMFDTYDGTVINLTLPKGMTILNAEGLGITGSSETGQWVLTLDQSISATAGSVASSLNFNVRLDGNGTLPINQEFAASEGSLIDAALTTQFTVKDKSNNGTATWDYPKTYRDDNDISPIVSASDDVWGIVKTNDGYEVSDDKETVTVKWTLAIGFDNTEEGASENSVVSNANSYAVIGRTGFRSFTLTENPTVTGRDGKAITPDSVTVTANFDEKQSYDFTTQKTKSIALDTCEGQNMDVALEDQTSPYYSTYTVEAVYQYDEFIAAWNDENQNDLDVVNTATIEYQRSGETETHTASDSATQSIGDVTTPAELTIGKEVQFYGDSSVVKPYSSSVTGWDWGDVSGDATFKIEVLGDNGSYSAATLYTWNSASQRYEEITGSNSNQVSINRTTDDDGKVTVYVEPGTYKITEIGSPAHTSFLKVSGTDFTEVENEKAAAAELASGAEAEVLFTNGADYGRIVVTKTGTKLGSSAAASEMAGAVFGLYTDDKAENPVTKVVEGETVPVTATVGSDGTAAFNNIPSGTYYVKEITAPAGYTFSTDIKTAVVTAGATVDEITFSNVYNGAKAKLLKQYLAYTTDEDSGSGSWSYTALTSSALQKDLEGKFALEKKVGDDWETVSGYGSGSLDGSGAWAPASELPVYETNTDGSVSTTPVKYRFREELPDGWHGDNESEDGEYAYSQEFTLEKALTDSENGYTHAETMYNRRTADITLSKVFRTMGTDGSQKNTNADAGDHKATFRLYQKVGDGAITAVMNNGQPVTATTDSSGKVVFSGLDVASTQNKTISYYLEETDLKSGYELKLADNAGVALSTETVDGTSKTLIGPFSFENNTNLSASVTAYNVEQKIPVTIIKKDGVGENAATISGAEFKVEIAYANDSAANETKQNVVSGSVLILDAAKGNITLTITETKAPQGYELNSTPQKETIVIPSGGVGLNQAKVEYTVVNEPYPSVTITKTVEGTAVSNSNQVTFEVYTKDNNGNFVRATYPGYSDGLSLTSGSTLRLPAGTYWLHEVVPENDPNKVLDPDKFFAQYQSKYPTSSTLRVEQKDNKTYFGPFMVFGTETSAINWGTIDNISAVGGVTVTKRVYTGTNDSGEEQFAVRSGAKVQIYHMESTDGEAEEKVDGTGTTNSNGTVTFSNLDVYDDNGQLITYYIRETEAPSGYDISTEVFETTLTSGETITKEAGTNGKDLIFTNYPLRDFTITKVVRDLWEYEFTGNEQLVSGAEIALYQLIEEGDVQAGEKAGDYRFVKSANTSSVGQVTFENLGKGTYVAIEVSCPEIDGQEAVPAGGKDLLTDKPDTLTADALKNYNYVILDDREDTNAKLINEIGWTQIRVEKVDSTTIDTDSIKKLNGAIFQLYKQTLPEGTEEDATLTFDPANPGEGTVLVGTYSSGTLADPVTGDIIDGQFATDILEAGENIVYWLVETEPAPGYAINEGERIILFHHPETSYRNSSNPDVEGTIQSTRAEDYPLNKIEKDLFEIKNDPLTDPGEERFAYVRLYKWAETDTEGTYAPLGGVKYQLHLSNQNGDLLDLIDEMTTGLESVIVPGSESTLAGAATSIRLDSNDYKGYVNTAQGEEGDIAWYGEDGYLYVRMALVETSAPLGYQVDGQPHYLIVCFKTGSNAEGDLINYDVTYFVPGKDTNAPLASDKKDYPEAGGDTSYRLTNAEMNNYSVTVRKYGYTPVDGQEGEYTTVGKTSDQLLADMHSGALSATRLEVTMKLQRKNDNGVWQDFKYDNGNGGFAENQTQTFTTTNGYFTFPNGLLEGEYRIIEMNTNAPAGYELLYNDADHARYFEVTDSNVEVAMFNPTKQSLTVKKTDVSGKAVTSGVSFALNGGTAQSVDGNGSVTFSNLGTGTYKLTEAIANGTALTDDYLVKYFTEKYPNAVNLVNGTGLKLGYDKSKSTETSDVTITGISTPEDYGLTGEITIANPPLVSLTLEKEDVDNAATKLNAGFTVYYQAFDSWSSHTVQPYGAEGASWTQVGTYTTGSDGTETISDQNPGVYYVVETTPPDGYAKDAKSKYVVLKGGMNINVDTDAVSKDTNVELVTGTDGSATMIFKDTKLGTLTVKKDIDWGYLDEELQASEYSFTFNLYDKDGKKVGTQVVTQANAETGVTFTGLNRDNTYYLEEDLGTGTEYKLETVTLNGETDTVITPEEAGKTNSGRYGVEITKEKLNVTVTVENSYQYAQFAFAKLGKQDESDDTPEYLSGAQFAVKKVTEGTGADAVVEDVTGAAITDNKDGTYTVKLPLTETGTYRVYETQAPDGYLTDQTKYIEVEDLEPGQNRDVSQNAAGQIINYQGAFIEITKYNNMKETEKPGVLSGAEFTLYSRTKGTEEGGWAVETNQTATTGEDGIVRFMVDGEKEYAVAETRVPDGYTGLQGVYSGDIKLATEELNGGTLYILGDTWTLGQTYEYEAYNIPGNLELEIRKKDISGSEVLPQAKVSVYEVSNDLTEETLTDQQVLALASSSVSTPLVEDVWTSKASADGTYSIADKEVSEKLGQIVAGKTYLIVEKEVEALGEGEYNLQMDNPDIVWYRLLKIPAGTSQKKWEVTLENAQGSVGLNLEKTAKVLNSEDDSVNQGTFTLPSLFEEGQEVEYTLTPTVTNDFALDSFMLTDSGLTAYDDNGDSLEDALKDGYAITEVMVGAASYDAEDFGYTADNNVQATVKFIGFDNQIISEETVAVSEGAKIVYAPSGEDAKNAASVEIIYSDEGFKTATGGEYALGKNFTPGAVTLKVTIDRQDGGENAEAISRIVNNADVKLTYRGWDGPHDHADSAELPAKSSADIHFGDLETPLASVTKDVKGEKDTEDEKYHVNLEEDITYTLTLSNISTDGAVMERPVLIDVLPEGTSVDTSTSDFAKIVGANPSGLEIDRSNVIAFGSGETGGQALILYFKNAEDGSTAKLAAGDSVQVEITVKTTSGTAVYDNPIRNVALASSQKAGVVTTDNPAGASFKGANNAWAELIEDFANVSSILGGRASALSDALEGEDLYGFIHSQVDVTWDTSNTLTLSKANYGSEDPAIYRSDRLARTANDGHVYYQLSVVNTDITTWRTDLTIIDVLPAVDDVTGSSGAGRGSQWPLYLSENQPISVKIDGEPVSSDHYKIYYYTGKVTNGNAAAVYAAVQNAQGGCPADWTENPDSMKKVTAFIVAIDRNESLKPNGMLTVEYTTDVGTYDAIDLAKIGYTNAVNNFAFHYSDYYSEGQAANADPAGRPLTSATVSATLIPAKVKVGGHVWIDADEDGTWDKGTDGSENLARFKDYQIVKDLLNDISITLQTYTTKDSSDSAVYTGVLYQGKESDEWNNDANFIFDNLDPAVPLGESELYPDNRLNAGDLKGDNPATYRFLATLSESVAKIFKLTDHGGSYMSQDPEHIPAKEQTDNNFNGSSSSSTSERFYLWQTPVTTAWDNTKDIGFTPYRTLTIQKRAADNAGVAVEGAEFEIYGPFEEGTAANAALTADKLVATKKTDESGRVSFDNLLWFMEYVIVEKTPADGYSLEDAAASGQSGVVQVSQIGDFAKWVLHIPEKEAGISNANQTVNVTNVRKVSAQFSVTKDIVGRDTQDGDSFTFELVASPDATDVLDTVTVSGEGTVFFDPITFTVPGRTYTYYIREQQPEDSLGGVTYDQNIYQVSVTTAWGKSAETGKNEMTVTDPVYRLCDENGAATGEDLTSVTFTNSYEATGTWQLTGNKTLAGRNLEDGEFTFTLTETDASGNPLTGNEAYSDTAENTVDGTDKSKGTFTFDTITYTENKDSHDASANNGNHYYLITESSVAANSGLAANTQQFLVTVQVTDDGKGALSAEITSVKERSGSETAWENVEAKESNTVDFANTYTASGTTALNGSKTVTGGPLRSFTFGIYTDENMENLAADTGDAARVAENQITVAANQNATSASFSTTVYFTEADITNKDNGTGTVTLYIREENASEDSATTNDTSVYRVIYSLADDGIGGITVAVREIAKKTVEGGQTTWTPDETASGVTFVNTYEAKGSVTLAAEKVLTGKNFEAEDFTFQLLASDGTTELQTKNAAAGGSAVQGQNNTYSAAVAFDPIEYTMDDLQNTDGTYKPYETFTYYIVEQTGSDQGIQYSKAKYKVDVTVTDAGNGTLSVFDPVLTQVLSDEGTKTDRSVYGATFTNHFTASGSVTLTATKSLQGQALSNEQFTFTLTDVTKGLAEADKVTMEPVKNMGTSVNFVLNNVYDQDDVGKTFTYEIRETAGETGKGYTYSEAVYRAEVTVSLDEENNEIVPAVAYTRYNEETKEWDEVDAEEVVFANAYAAHGEATISGSKTVTYRDAAVEKGEFGFLLKEGDNEIATIQTKAGGAFSYTFQYDITPETTSEALAALLGTHTYTLTEIVPDDADTQIEYSVQEYTIEITVDDNDRDGQLNVSTPVVTEKTAGTVAADAVNFNNTYQAEGSAVLNITKTLTGNRAEGIGENEFSFTATEVDAEGNAAADGQIAYSQMSAAGADDKYTAAGTITLSYDETDLNEDGSAKTYWYAITEDDVKSTSGGVTKDDPDAVYYAKVVVSDGGDHTIDTVVTYHTEIGGDAMRFEEGATPGVAFINNYTATGMAKISGTKELTGNRKDAIGAEEFQFEVVNTTTEEVVGTAQTRGGAYTEDFKVTFGRDVVDGNVVPFTQADISDTAYTNYALREVNAGETSIDYDETIYPLSVTVSDSTTQKGTLVITATRADGNNQTVPKFTNKYLATGTGSISGTKELTGNRLNTGAVVAGEFTFQVVDGNGNVVGTATNDAAGRFTIAEIYKTSATDGEGTVTYIPFNQDDIREEAYTGYTLVEVDKDDTDETGIIYNPTGKTYPLTITVRDKDGKGSLNVDVQFVNDGDTGEFTNEYHASGVGVIELTKSLTGRPTGLTAGEFQYEIFEVVNNERVQLTTDGTNPLIVTNDFARDAEGNPASETPDNIRFEISYTEENQGTHTYVIKERNTGDPNITYDQSEITVTVTVTDDGDGTMTVETSYPSDTTFDNSYTATGAVRFSGVKRVLGGRAAQVEENEFKFTVIEQITDGEGNVTEETVANGYTLDGGQIEFAEISYNQDDRNDPEDPDDVHTYLIYEDAGNDNSISYAADPVTVTVKVTDAVDPETGEYLEGQLDTAVTYPVNEDSTAGVVFENQYLAEGSITLEGTKELLGNRANALADGEFTFEVRELDAEGNPGENAVTTGESKADGTIEFQPIEYKVEAGRSDIGTHKYVISEAAGTNAAVDYTEAVFTVTVEVTDLGSGNLDAQVVAADSDTVAFQNQYLANGELVLNNFSKTLTDSTLTEGQFSFQLTDAEGNVLQTVNNGADGSIVFDALAYDQDDIGQEFVYTVSEVNSGINGVTYDENVYTVRVAVADSADSDGTLVITPTVLNGDSVIDPAEGELLPAVAFTNEFDGSVTLTKQGADRRTLAGAQFQLYAAVGEDRYEIYATEENPEGLYTTGANGILTVTNLPANTYYFVETQAPQGYAIETDENGQPMRYEFTIGVEGTTENAVVNAEITVTDPLATTGSIQVTKRVSTLDDDFNYVDFTSIHETYYVGIFTDAAGTQPYGTNNIKSIRMDGVAVSDPVVFDGLTTGTYYILETDAQGNPIPLNESQTMNGSTFYCMVEGGGTNEVTLDLTTDETAGTVRLQNVYMEFSDDYYWEASLDITKRVLRNGVETTVDDTFHAGVYQRLENGSYELLVEVELLQNDTVTVSGLGGPVGGSMTYYVFETDGNGNMISDDPNFMYSVSGEGSVTITETDTTGRVTITNEAVEETTTVETEGSSTTTSTTSSSSGTTSGKSVKTGDTTNIMPALISLIVAGLAVIALGCGIYRRRRRNGK